MAYTLTFLDHRLYQCLSFDADIKFPDYSEYTKKFWILKEYAKTSSKISLGEKGENPSVKTNSSYSIEKSFRDDGELVVELIQNIKFSDNFDYFAKAEIQETEDEELEAIFSEIKASDFDVSKIKELFHDCFEQ